MSNQVMRECKLCGGPTLHVQPSTSHLLHGLLSLLTFGAWILVWFFVAQSNASQSRCTKCGGLKGMFGTVRGGKVQPHDVGLTPSPLSHVKCPDCAELVLKEARVCKHCGCRLIPQ